MVPTPLQIVLMVTAIANAISDACKLACTPGGQKMLERMDADRQKWDEFWMDVGKETKRFFTGDLFKEAPKP